MYAVGSPLSLEQISFYQERTNNLTNRKLLIDRFPVSILPIDEVGLFGPLNCPYSVSQFIPGQNLHNANLYNIGFSYSVLERKFSNLSEVLNSYAGTEGIFISLINVKFLPDIGFMVTDLCAEIRNFAVLS